jgi:hypothetical protein
LKIEKVINYATNDAHFRDAKEEEFDFIHSTCKEKEKKPELNLHGRCDMS